MIVTWVAFVLYCAAAVGLGWWASRSRDEGADFWTAGRSLGAASVGLSISAGFLSVSWSCVYAVQLFYWYGAGAVWLITVPWMVALLGIHRLARRYHALSSFSQPEMVGERFGRAARLLVAGALTFVFLVWGGAEIHVAGRLLAPQLGIGAAATMLVISVVVGIYSTLGGFRAVVSTDRLQYALVAVYMVAMAALAALGLRQAGGSSGIDAALLAGAKTGRPWSDLLAPGWATIVLTFAAYLPGWLFETDLWLRVQAARDARAARRGVLVAMLNGLLFVGLMPLFIGVAALVLFPLQAGAFPAEIGVEGDAILAALVARYAPGWMAVLVAVGLVAAAMSTIDTCVNVMALSLAYDLFAAPGRSAAAGARLARRVTVAAVAASALFALGLESLWDVFYLSSGVLTTAVAFPVAAIFLPRVGRRAVVWSSAAGLATTVAAYFLETRGLLAGVEPAWLAGTGVGFVLWGVAAALGGALAGQLRAPGVRRATS